MSQRWVCRAPRQHTDRPRLRHQPGLRVLARGLSAQCPNVPMTEPEDPTRLESARRPIAPQYPAPAGDATTFLQVWTLSGVLCLECRQCNKRTALTKTDLPRSFANGGCGEQRL